MTALQRCIAVPADEFAGQYWGRRPLLTNAQELPARFDDLLDEAGVDELVSRRGLRTPFLRMAKNGDVLAPARYARGGGAGASVADQVADDLVLARMDDGATLVLQALHRTWPPIVEFAAQLSGELGHPVQVNAYVTPAGSRGFAAHYDVHDVFVLQLAGRKRWRVHEPVLTDPLGDQPWEQRRAAVTQRAEQAPLIDEVLAPGDALYLPRGYLHSAVAQGELSIHLTVGVHPMTRYHLVRHLLDAAAADAALRGSLPMGVALDDPTVLDAQLRETVAALHRHLDAISVADVADRVAADLRRQTRPAPIGPLQQLAWLAALDASTPLRLRAGLRCTLLREEAGPREAAGSDEAAGPREAAGSDEATGSDDAAELRLRLLGKTVSLPAAAEPAVKAVLAGEAFTPGQLPGLDADEQLSVARTLLREAIVVPAAARP